MRDLLGRVRSDGLPSVLRAEWAHPRRRHSYVLMLNTALMSVLGLAYWVVVGRVVDAATLGVGASILGVASLVNVASRVGLDTALLRRLGAPGEDPRRLLRLCGLVVALVALLLALAYVAYLTYGAPEVTRGLLTPGSATLLAFALASLSVGFLLDAALLASSRHAELLAKNLTYSVVRIPFSLALVPVFGAAGLAVGCGAAMLLCAALPALRLWRASAPVAPAAVTAGPARSPLRLGGDAVADYGVNVLLLGPGLLLPAVVLHFSGPSAAAYVYMAWMLANLAFVVPTAIGQAQLVGRAGAAEESHRRPVLLGLLAALGMAACAPLFLLLLGDPAFLTTAYPLFLVLVAATPLLAVEHLAISRHRAARRHVPALLLGLVQCGVLLASVAWALPRGGLGLMALAWMGGHAALAAYCLRAPRPAPEPEPEAPPFREVLE